MIKVSRLYTNKSNARFDYESYAQKHMPLVKEELVPLGLIRYEINRGLTESSPFIAMDHLYFKSVEEFRAAFKKAGDRLISDLRYHTDIKPQMQISEVVAEGQIGSRCADKLCEELSVERIKDRESIINGISDAMMLLDAKSYEILDVNQAFLDSYKLDYEDAVGRKCHEVTHDLSMPCWQASSEDRCPLHQGVLTSQPCYVEHVHKDSEGNPHFFEITSYPIKDSTGEVSRIIHLSRDVTERRLAEEALKEASEKTKMLAYSVAHDLKNPVIAIHGLISRFKKHYEKALDEKGKKYCQQIVNASQEVETLLNDINLFISAKESSLTLDVVNLNEIFGSVREEYADQMTSRKIRWSQPNETVVLRADRLSVVRILRNLIQNSLKYGGDSLREVTVGHREDDEFHVICVTDDGMGVKGNESEKIFEPFKRNPPFSGIEGTGLGLAIVDEIARQHQGKVWLEPAKEKGATFCVSLSKNLGLVEQ